MGEQFAREMFTHSQLKGIPPSKHEGSNLNIVQLQNGNQRRYKKTSASRTWAIWGNWERILTLMLGSVPQAITAKINRRK
jgi:hypothetical protein